MSFLLTPPHKVHGLQPGCRYVPPPLDGSLTLPQIYDFNYEYNRDFPVFIYPNGLGGTRVVPFSEVVPAAHQAGRYIAKAANVDLNADPATYPMVGILAASDTITFFTTVLGALRAGIPVFLISYRNSILGLAHLLSKVNVSHVLVSADPATQALAQGALDEMKNEGKSLPGVSLMPTYGDIYLENTQFVPLPPRTYDYSAASVVIHSSGTSSFPKPIIWSARTFLQAAVSPHFGTHDLCGQVIGCQSIAMFHAIGVIFLSWISTTGLAMGTFAPASPATIPTPDAVFEGLTQIRPTYAFVVPSFIEAWSQDRTKLPLLCSLKGLLYSGAPLNKGAGDQLAKEGVNLFNIYGLSEVSLVAKFIGEPVGRDWEFFELNPHCAAELVPNEDGSYEAFVVSKPTQELPVVNTTFNGKPAYATGDLLLPHPSRPGFWKIFGRGDEQIMLSTGEKTNPGPLEGILRQHPRVAAAVMFGRGRFQNGVLLELKSEYQFDPADQSKLAEFKDSLRPQLEELNTFAPSHSRLFKEMIIVASPTKPFTYSAKRAPKRVAILQDYEKEIEATYASVEEHLDLVPPVDWSLENSLKFVRAAVINILRNSISDDQDIFAYGCDSLQATWIRRLITQALQKTSEALVSTLSLSFVYNHPTIISLAEYVSNIAIPDSQRASGSKSEELEDLVLQHTLDFPLHTPTLPALEEDVVLVTGTTGSLGSAILAELFALESVRHIYAYNRHSSRPILERQREALGLRGYDQAIASSSKVSLIEGNLDSIGLGLDDTGLEEEIRNSVTHIIHAAWRVDFNLAVTSFKTNIRGVRSLIDFALSSPRPVPPRLVFASSIGVLRNFKSDFPAPEMPINDPNIPVGQGYSESKWVAEQILYAAERNTPIRPVVVRVGQISGGINGAWNTSDWVPAIIRSSVTLGCLPAITGTGACSWVNLHLAGKVLTEVRNARSSTVHLVHPRPTQWNDLIKVFSLELRLPVVPYADWVNLLEEVGGKASELSEPRLKDIPAFLLLDFLKGALESATRDVPGKEVMGTAKLSIDQGLAASRALSDGAAVYKLGSRDVRRWLSFWKGVGYLV